MEDSLFEYVTESNADVVRKDMETHSVKQIACIHRIDEYDDCMKLFMDRRGGGIEIGLMEIEWKFEGDKLFVVEEDYDEVTYGEWKSVYRWYEYTVG